jgi:hypothetical protein
MTRRWLPVLLLCSLAGATAFPGLAAAQTKAGAAKTAPTKPADSNVSNDAETAATKGGDSSPQSGAQAREKTLSGATKAGAVQGSVKVEENKEGVKSYTFGAQELEGRLKSPQILYFLRRVRAQFDPSGLGHRSFMRELSDTRRHRAVR